MRKWEQKAKENRAMRNFALGRGKNLKDVSIEMVAEDEIGIDGWSEMTLAVGGSVAKAKPKPGAENPSLPFQTAISNIRQW